MYLLLPCTYPKFFNLPWKSIFGLLCVEKFAEIYPLFDFPVEPTDEIRNIAQGFLEAFFGLLANDVAEAPFRTVDFFSRIPADASYEEKHNILFQLTFAALEELGCAAVIYEWAAESSFFKPLYKNRKQIEVAKFLFREWAIDTWRDQGDISNTDDSADVKEMTQDWQSFGKPEKSLSRLSEFPIPLDAKAQAQLFEHELRYFHLKNFGVRLKRSIATPWEEFVFFRGTAGGSTISNEGYFRISVSEWRAVCAQLRADEIERVEMWLMAQVDADKRLIRAIDFSTPLPTFDK
jgi:hypothetical protein